MKRHLLTTLLLPLSLLAQEEEYSFQEFNTFDNMGSDVSFETPMLVWQIKANGNVSGEAKFNTGDVKGQNFRFGEAEAAGSFIHLISDNFGYSLSIGYQYTLMDWKENPAFRNNDFHNGYVSLGVKGRSCDCWTWQAEVSANADLDLFNEHSTLYLYGGWGTHEVNSCFSTSVGFIGRSGIRQDRFWPVLGFQWDFTKSWSLHFVFPVDMALIYKINDSWATALVYRIFNNRHRLGPNEPLANGIVEYRNSGLELALNYNYGPIFSANIHAGVLAEGDLKVSNYHDRFSTHYKADPTGYVGADLSVRF